MTDGVIFRLIDIMRQQGVFDIYFPFLLTFSIFYALLTKMQVFGKTEKGNTSTKISALVSLIAASYITLASPASITISQFFASFFATTSLALVGMMGFMLIVGMLLSFNYWEDTKTSPYKWIILAGGLITVVVLLSTGILGAIPVILPRIGLGLSFEINQDAIVIGGLIVGTLLVVWFLSRGEPPKEPDFMKKSREKQV